MTKSILVVACVLCLSQFCFGQYQLAILEKAKEIKLLDAHHNTVRSLFRDYELDHSSDSSDDFSGPDGSIEITYSGGTCDEDEEEIWDAPKGKVTRIEIVPNDELRFEAFALDTSQLTKEQMYADSPETVIYHNKAKGMAIEVSEDIVQRFILFPAVNKKVKTCKYKSAKEFASSESWFGSQPLEERTRGCVNSYANVTDLSLDREEISALGSKEIAVTATDDGCGICGQTKTKTIVIK